MLGELLGIALLLAFIFAAVTMPPLKVTREESIWTSYSFSVDTEAWKENAVTYWQSISKGSLGEDRSKRPVAPMIATRFRSSLRLLGYAAVVTVLLGVMKGILDFRSFRRGRYRVGPAITGIIQGIPDFWLVILLQLVAILLFRTYQWRPYRVTYLESEEFKSLIAPVICLSLIPASFVARITARALMSVWDLEFIRTAHAKGLTERRVLFRHALRSSAVQILDGLPNVAAVMVANLVIVEYMFGYPGLVQKFQDSIPGVSPTGSRTAADIPVMAASALCLGLTFTVLNLAIKGARRLADPRLRERGTP